jgi:hypothetical protein
MSFPDKLYCESSSDDLVGPYSLIDSRSRDFSEILVSHEAMSPYVYLNANHTHTNLLVYCEGTPDLIPADKWRSVISEAISRNPRASLSASMHGEDSDDAVTRISSDIKKVAMNACKDLVGWVIFTEKSGLWMITARCVRCIDPDTPTTISASPLGSTGRYARLTSDCSNVWEVRSKRTSESIIPWIKKNDLDSRWFALLSQPGCFECSETKPVSVVLRPITSSPKEILPTVDESTISTASLSTMITPPVSPYRSPPYCGSITNPKSDEFCWEIEGSRQEDSQPIESPKFQYRDQEYRLRVTGLHSSHEPFVSVSLMILEGKKFDVKFSVKIDCGGDSPPISSGWKRMGPEGIFKVLFDRNRVTVAASYKIGVVFDNGQ